MEPQLGQRPRKRKACSAAELKFHLVAARKFVPLANRFQKRRSRMPARAFELLAKK
jgi:hypothetical protein